MKKSKLIKFEKRNSARTPAAKKPFDFTAYRDADKLVDAYFEYKHGRSLKDMTIQLLSPDPDIANLIKTCYDRSEDEELELRYTNKKYREWDKNAELFETAAHVAGILRDDDEMPEEYRSLTPENLEYVCFNVNSSNKEIRERFENDVYYHYFMRQINKYDPLYMDESTQTFYSAVYALADFFDFKK